MSTITTKIYYKDLGSGQPVVFSHGWPLTGDAWENQMFFLAERGFRCIAHDRRGHGRSSQPWQGNEMDTYADDLAELFTALDLNDVVMVGHSTGGGVVARYIGRHGTKRVAKAVLMGTVPPIMVKTKANPGGLPIEVFDGFRKAYLADRSQVFYRASGPFFGFNLPGAKVSRGLIQSWWMRGMMSGFKNAYDCIRHFRKRLHRGLKKIRRAHADPARRQRPNRAGRRSGPAFLETRSASDPKNHSWGSHSLGDTAQDEVNAIFLKFIKS